MEQQQLDGPINGEIHKERPINWLVNELFKVNWNPLVENRRLKPMEGHLEIFNEHETDPDAVWKKLYFRTKDGRFQWFASHCADEHPISDILLTGTTISCNKEDWTIRLGGGKEAAHIIVRVPSNVFEKWHQALLSHSNTQLVEAFIQPTFPPAPHRKNRVILLEIGNWAIASGILTQKPSLPLSFFPALCAIGHRDDGRQEVVCGIGAFAEHEDKRWRLIRPIEYRDEDALTIVNENALRAVLEKALIVDAKNQAQAMDIRFRPQDFLILLATAPDVSPSNAATILKILLDRTHYGFKGVALCQTPKLVLYSYDVTTGVVVELGEQLSIVPIIDEFVVDDAVYSFHRFGAPQIREQMQKRVNNLQINLIGESESAKQLILRTLVEKACYVATGGIEEERARGAKEVLIELGAQGQSIKVDGETRFVVPEGLFNPNLWGLEQQAGLHRMVHEAIQKCPIDSRRTLYRNVFLTGGTSLLPGLAERLEHELVQLAPASVLVQVLNSPWRRHSAYLGAHVIASGDDFDKCAVGEANLAEYLRRMEQGS